MLTPPRPTTPADRIRTLESRLALLERYTRAPEVGNVVEKEWSAQTMPTVNTPSPLYYIGEKRLLIVEFWASLLTIGTTTTTVQLLANGQGQGNGGGAVIATLTLPTGQFGGLQVTYPDVETFPVNTLGVRTTQNGTGASGLTAGVRMRPR